MVSTLNEEGVGLHALAELDIYIAAGKVSPLFFFLTHNFNLNLEPIKQSTNPLPRPLRPILPSPTT